MKKEKMIEYCKVLTSMLLLTLCVLVYNSVIASGDELIRCKEKEREALLKFKQGLIDDGDCLSSWGSEEDKRECCKWNGITCSNKTGHVIGLLLGCGTQFCSTPLRGKISSVLIELNYLSHMDLSFNDFGNVEIPKFIGSLEKLQHLNLEWSEFSGAVPHELGNLTNLRKLYLGGNKLIFDNLDWLHHLSSLSLLDLSYSHLRHTNLLQDILKLPSLKELYLNSGHFPTYFSVNSSSTSLSVLHMSYSGLTSSSFQWMFNISTRLRSIDLSRNNLSPSIPNDFGRLTFLQHLDLSHNQLTGGIPECLGNLSHLQTLDLSFNDISEPLSELFYKLYARANHQSVLESLSSLRNLWLRENQLNGSFPRGFARVSRLDDLDVSMLESLDVSFNSLQGIISDTHLSKLHNLKVLDLSFNSLVLNVSVDWIPPFQLDVINLASCNLGPRFPPWLRTQTNFSQLDLSCNGILEQGPEWLWDLSPRVAYLNLSHNQIIGSIPDLSLKYDGILDISYNNLSGRLPLSLPFFKVLLLSDNMFVGSISSICEVSQWLNVLDLSNNQFSGEVPDCWENKTEIVILNLSNNKFSGYIPHTLGSLKQLTILQLHNNNFSGELPSTLMNCSNLQMFDVGGNKLGGNIPAWIGTHVSYLRVLSLGHNTFNGTIPLEICYLMHIQTLDLSRNFLSGRIPQCFNNFTSFIQKNITFGTTILSFGGGDFPEYDGFIDHALVQWKGNEAEYRKTTVGLLKLIDLSSNKLVGNLPHEFSQLQALISLNLSRNYLSGNIISDIGKMEMLESLDLSRNAFSGEIPNGLAKLDHLAVLDMSNNHLSGEIPSGTQLQSFDPSAYAGNSGLCGLPLVSCPGHDPNPSTTQQENIADAEDDSFISLLLSHEVYITIILGFIVGFWGVVGTLVLKNSWRYAYFNFFSRIGDWLYVRTTIYAARLRRSLRTNEPRDC